jgi:hypothetical protein
MEPRGENLMVKKLAFIAAAFVVAAWAGAESVQLTWETAFGRFQDKYGVWHGVPKGLKVPVTATRIDARPIGKPKPPARNFGGNGLEAPAAITEVYKNYRGTNNFYTPDMASALDDVTLAQAGYGERWYNFTMAAYSLETNFSNIMYRTRAWNSYVTGRGAGVQAFDNQLFDVGWTIGPLVMQEGTWEYRVDAWRVWSQVEMRVPSGVCYFAQQWRQWQSNGEGAFLEGVYATVFSGDGPPTIGASDDVFWYDWDPFTNGVYSEDELDFYGGSPNEANFLLVVRTNPSGTQEIVRPTTYAIRRGTLISGNVGSLHFIDSNQLQVRRGLSIFAGDPPLQVEMDGFSSSTNLVSMNLRVVATASTANLQQSVQAFNFSTNEWVTVDTRAATTTEQNISVAVSNPNQYVNTDGTMRMKVRYLPVGPVANSNWSVSLNQSIWENVRP